jgi:hypothetical protein
MVSRWSRVSCSAGKKETQESQGAKELEAIRQEVQLVKVCCSAGKIKTQESHGVQVVKSLLLSR